MQGPRPDHLQFGACLSFLSGLVARPAGPLDNVRSYSCVITFASSNTTVKVLPPPSTLCTLIRSSRSFLREVF